MAVLSPRHPPPERKEVWPLGRRAGRGGVASWAESAVPGPGRASLACALFTPSGANRHAPRRATSRRLPPPTAPPSSSLAPCCPEETVACSLPPSPVRLRCSALLGLVCKPAAGRNSLPRTCRGRVRRGGDVGGFGLGCRLDQTCRNLDSRRRRRTLANSVT